MIDRVVERENLTRALKRVRENKGAPGTDGMTVGDLTPYLRIHWPRLKQEILAGTYQPKPVRAVEIPKPNGGVRVLGIPCVVDRFVQQAILQALTPVFDPHFSESSHGYRPGRNAQQAVKAGFAYAKEGWDWVADLDVEKFFDRVNWDALMARVARRVRCKTTLRLIRSFLKAGIMSGGLVRAREEGTPQGSPLSPLLSNIYLDDLDKELERRGHKFCRYADDANVYVKSRSAAERVMASLERFLKRRLKLTVNRTKSVVDRPWNRTFLGHTMTRTKSRLAVSPKSVKRAKDHLKMIFKKGRGWKPASVVKVTNAFTRGWAAYYVSANQWRVYEELDGWIRRRFRWLLWRQWKRKKTRVQRLMALGLDKETALKWGLKNRGPWWHSKQTHMNSTITTAWLARQGLLSMLGEHRRLAGSASS
jgi:RNA-directed DNA polymerase